MHAAVFAALALASAVGPRASTTAPPRATPRAAAFAPTATSGEAGESGRVGFLGLGIMGEGMAANLLSTGHDLLVWSRDTAKCHRLAAAHPEGRVSVAPTPRDVVAACDLTWSMLSTPEASAAVFDDDGTGAVAGVGPGTCVVDCATLTPARMVDIASRVRRRGGLFLEAPVSGSKKPAADGQLVFLCSGDREAAARAQSGLQAMGKATHYYGEEAGLGTRMKLAVNMVMGAQLAAIGEGVALCEAAGLDASALVEVLCEGAMASPMVSLKGKAMADRSYPPAFPLVHAQKDMRFALDLADSLGVALPVAASANELFKAARGQGWGNDDFAAVCEVSRVPLALASSSSDQ